MNKLSSLCRIVIPVAIIAFVAPTLAIWDLYRSREDALQRVELFEARHAGMVKSIVACTNGQEMLIEFNRDTIIQVCLLLSIEWEWVQGKFFNKNQGRKVKE